METLFRKRILVTGLEGFTGQYLKPLLEAKQMEIFNLGCDLNDKKAVLDRVKDISPEYVIHLAGLAFAAHEDETALYRVNTVGTTNLLESLKEAHVSKIILASSATVYGNQTIDTLHEELCPAPLNHYGCSKLAMEYLSMAYRDVLPLIIARPFNYTGVGQANYFLIPKIVHHFREKSSHIELGNIHVAREFCDVRWIVQLYVALLTCKAQGVILNLCQGVATPISAVLNTLQELTGHAIEVKTNPAFVRQHEIVSLKGSNQNLRNTLGKLPNTPRLDETLSWMLS